MERYYRPHLKDIKTLILNYNQIGNLTLVKKNVLPIQEEGRTSINSAHKTGELMTFDIAGPFAQTVRGQIFHRSLRPLQQICINLSLKRDILRTVAKVLVDHMCRYGISESVLSDQGYRYFKLK